MNQTDEQKTDSSVFQTVTQLFSKGLDLGIALTTPQSKQSPSVSASEPKSSKIMGIPKPMFFGGIAVVGLVTTVVIIKKMKK